MRSWQGPEETGACSRHILYVQHAFASRYVCLRLPQCSMPSAALDCREMNKMQDRLNDMISGQCCRRLLEAERAEGANPNKKAKHAEAAPKQAKQQERIRSCHVPAVPQLSLVALRLPSPLCCSVALTQRSSIMHSLGSHRPAWGSPKAAQQPEGPVY